MISKSQPPKGPQKDHGTNASKKNNKGQKKTIGPSLGRRKWNAQPKKSTSRHEEDKKYKHTGLSRRANKEKSSKGIKTVFFCTRESQERIKLPVSQKKWTEHSPKDANQQRR